MAVVIFYGFETLNETNMNIKRIEEIQKETAYPDSISVQQALLKVWNECEQEKAVKNNAVLPLVSNWAYKLVRIGWADAIENLEGWHTEKEALEWADDDDWIVHQVGWVLKETDDYILLSNKYNEASGGRDGTFGGLFKIPKPWIKYCNEV